MDDMFLTTGEIEEMSLSKFRRNTHRSGALKYQSLEQRQLLASFTVTTLLDSADGSTDGQISLREAIIATETNAPFGDAPAGELGGDTIRFDAALDGQTIALTNGELAITQRLNIVGGGTDVTISADLGSRVFNINTSDEVRLSGITVSGEGQISSGGVDVTGGGLLRLSQVVFRAGGGFDFDTFSSGSRSGGAIHNVGSEIISIGSSFVGNSAVSGGAIYSEDGRLFLRDNTFERNLSDSRGGAIHLLGGSHFFDTVTFDDNTAVVDQLFRNGGTGGAVFVAEDAELTARDSTFSENEADTGGAIYVESGAMLRVRANFTDNLARGSASFNGTTSPNGRGGGIYSEGELTIFGGTFESNSAAEGGGLYALNADTTVINAQFLSNRSQLIGGAIAVSGGQMRIIDTVIGGDLETDGNSAIGNTQFGAFGSGGGVGIVDSAQVRIEGGRVANNQTLARGGAISVASGSRLQLSDNVSIDNNSTGIARPFFPVDFQGGGIYSAGTLRIDGALIDGNSSDGFGGGVYVADGSARIENAEITRNSANVGGGGIAVGGGQVLLSQSVVGGDDFDSQNVAGIFGAEDAEGLGGGIYVAGDEATRLRMIGGQLNANIATLAGGGLYSAGGIVNLFDVEVALNRAQLTDGGGVYNDGGRLLVRDSVFSDNMARDGAALYNNAGELRLVSSTVTENEARRVAGGLYERVDLLIADNDIFDNVARSDADIFQEA